MCISFSLSILLRFLEKILPDAAYRKKALRLHPDKNQDNPDKAKLEQEFKELNRVS